MGTQFEHVLFGLTAAIFIFTLFSGTIRIQMFRGTVERDFHGIGLRQSMNLHNCLSQSVLCSTRKNDQSAESIEDPEIYELKKVFHRLVTSVDHGAGKCSEVERFGRVEDGGYDVCMSPPFRPQPGNCLVYSFGIRDDWSFDEGMAKHGCEVHAFDPSIGLEDHLHAPNIHFHSVGIWSEDIVDITYRWKLEKLSTIRRRLGHDKRPISVLKIDTEGAEWPFLRDVIVRDPTQLADVSQLIFELHSLKLPNKLTKSNLNEMIYYIERLLDSSSEGQGFVVRGSNHTLNCCEFFAPLMPHGVPDRCAYEVFLVNARFPI